MAETLTIQTDSESLTINTGGATEVVSVGSVGPQGPQGDSPDLSSPPPIGDVLPNSGNFTTLTAVTGNFTTISASGIAILPHIHGSLAGNLYIHVKNTSGQTLQRGTPVYIVGNVGASDRVEVAAADFDDNTKMPAVGLLEQSLNNNDIGDAIVVGELNQADTSAFSLNDELFVGNNGTLTASRPTTGNLQSVGIVSRVQQNAGVIVVNMQGERDPDFNRFDATGRFYTSVDIVSGSLNITLYYSGYSNGKPYWSAINDDLTTLDWTGSQWRLYPAIAGGGVVYYTSNDADLFNATWEADPSYGAMPLPTLNFGSLRGDSSVFAEVVVNDVNTDLSKVKLTASSGNSIEFETQELTVRHTGDNDTPYINCTDGTNYALFGLRQGDMFLQGSNSLVRIEQGGGTLADIAMRSAVFEDDQSEEIGTFNISGLLTQSRTYDLPDRSGTLALTNQLTDIQVFTASDTWTKPAGAKYVHLIMIGAGGGGGSGRRGASGTARFGGGGGAGGAIVQLWVDADRFNTVETVTIGAGGLGGANRPNNTNGLVGGLGGLSSFGPISVARGNSGAGGTTSSAIGGAASNAVGVTYALALNTSAGGGSGTNAANSVFVPAGGGGGGGLDASDNPTVGGVGGNNGGSGWFIVTGGTSTNNSAGGNGAMGLQRGGSGGGGGRADSTTKAGNIGGNGGNYGAGGGGGSAAQDNAGGSTAGGDGGQALIIATTFF